MRRLFCGMLLCAMALMLSACAAHELLVDSGSEELQDVLHIAHFLDPSGQDPYDLQTYALFERFTRETGIQIELQIVPWDQLDEMLLVSSRSNEPLGDLCILSAQKLEYLVNGNALLPLDDYFEASFERSEFLPLALEVGTSSFDGKLYLMPQSLHTRGLWYNKNYVDQPPQTLDELLETALEVMDSHEGVYGLGFWGGSHYGAIENTLCSLAWVHGGALSDDQGRAIWANQAVADSIRLMYDWVYRYGISPEICFTTADGTDVQEMFYNGELAMIFDGCYAYSRNEFNYSSTETFGFAPMPGLDGWAETMCNGWAWGIPVNSPQPDLAWSFIEWFESCEIQIEHARIEGALPTRVDALSDNSLSEFDFMPSFIENLLQYGRRMDTFIYYAEAMDALTGVACEYSLNPDLDLEGALEEAQTLFIRRFYS